VFKPVPYFILGTGLSFLNLSFEVEFFALKKYMYRNSTVPIKTGPAKGTTVIIKVLIVLILWLSLYIPFS
jgi:hypothetical protein